MGKIISAAALCGIILTFMLAPARAGEAANNRIGKKSMAALLKIAADDHNPDQLRAVAALAQAKVNDPAFIKLLPGVYNRAGDTTMAAAALWALGEAGPAAAETAKTVLKAALNAPQPLVRTTALEVLVKLNLPLDKSLTLLRDREVAVRLAMIDAIRDKQAFADFLPQLAALQEKEQVPAVRLRIIECVRTLPADAGSADTLEKLYRRGLQDADRSVQLAVCRNLAAAAPQKYSALAPAVEKLLTHAWVPLRAQALETLGNIAPDKVRSRLAEFFTHADPRMQQAALNAAGRIYTEAAAAAALPPLFTAAAYEVRRAAAQAVRQMFVRKVIDRAAMEKIAVEAAKSSAPESQIEGLWLLGQLQSQAFFPEALTLGSSKDPRIVRLTLWLIGESKYEKGAELAQKIFKDGKADDLTRSHAVIALGKINAQQSVPDLNRLVKEIKTVQMQKVWMISGRLREDTVEALLRLNSPQSHETIDDILFSTMPPEDESNVKKICRWLIANNRQDAVEACEVVLKNSKFADSCKVHFAEVYEKLSGKKANYKPSAAGSYSETFINIEE